MKILINGVIYLLLMFLTLTFLLVHVWLTEKVYLQKNDIDVISPAKVFV